MKVNKLFPVIVPEFTYEEDLEEIKEALRSERREQFNFPEGVETTCGNLHKNERFHSLVEWFEECLEEYKMTFALQCDSCLLYTSPSPRDQRGSRMPSSA